MGRVGVVSVFLCFKYIMLLLWISLLFFSVVSVGVINDFVKGGLIKIIL